jgi:protein-S-isoprenylcysteine O-methyltransferase Ste14
MVYGFYRHNKIDTITLISGMLFLLGAALGLTARYQLKDAFSVKPQAKILIRNGIYSKIRHPIYAAGIIINIGFCLLYQNIIFYLALILLVIIQVARIRKEEALLAAAFGQEYQNYKNSTWF